MSRPAAAGLSPEGDVLGDPGDWESAAAGAVAAALAAGAVRAADVPLVLVGYARPGTGRTSPLLDGEVAQRAVHRILVGNGLLAAVPLGIAAEEDRLADAAIDCASAIMDAEGLPVALVVTVGGTPPRARCRVLRPGADERPGGTC